MTANPDVIKAVLGTQFREFGEGERFRRDWHDFMGDSFFTSDLDKWHTDRQLIRPLFGKDRVSDLNVFEKHLSRLLPLLKGGGQTVEIDALFLGEEN
jgi:hypothetical protein